MNFYKRFMGDYAKDTAHLSLAEHGAYTLLLDHYYATEQPLPADYQALYRICRAFDKKEQEAVRSVADVYFPVNDEGGRINPRAEKQLSDDTNRVESARVNGKKGGRPKKQTQPVNEKQTEKEPEKNPLGFDSETQQEPNTKAHHSQSQNKEKPSSPDADFAGLRFQEFWEAWPKTERRTAKAECLKKWKLRHLDAIADRVLEHVKAMKTTKKWQDGFEPAPLTYINQKHWEDGLPNQVDDDVFSRAAL